MEASLSQQQQQIWAQIKISVDFFSCGLSMDDEFCRKKKDELNVVVQSQLPLILPILLF